MSDLEQDDEIVTVELPRSEYKILRTMIKREEVTSYVWKKITNNSIYIIGGGLLTLFLLWEKVQHLLFSK